MSNKNLFVSIATSSKPNEKQKERLIKINIERNKEEKKNKDINLNKLKENYTSRDKVVSKDYSKSLEGNNYAGYSKIGKAADKKVSKVVEGVGSMASRLYKKLASQRVISRQVLKKNNMQVHIQQKEIPSVLGDENRFFKGELNRERRSLFFS
jgi:hypothetical protein